MAALADIVIDRAERSCCGQIEACEHTVIQHGKCTGFLAHGELLCRQGDGPLRPCRLGTELHAACTLVSLLEGHRHGPECGHEMIPHGDHMDFLVEDRLHHVVTSSASSCCDNNCYNALLPGVVVDHGRVAVLRRRMVHGAHGNDGAGGGSESGQPMQAASALREGAATAAQHVSTKIFVAGICCPSEVPIIHRLLEPLPGVQQVEVMVVTKQVTVMHDAAAMSPAALVAALNSASLQASLTGQHLQQSNVSWLPPWRILVCGVLVLISWFGKITSPAWVEYLKYVALGAIALGTPPIAKRAWGALLARTLDVNMLMIIAVAGAIALGDYEEGGTIVGLFALAEWLEDRCIRKARGALEGVLLLQPETALLASSGEAVPVEQVAVDDEVLVRPGDKVPVDGVVLAGTSTVDESMLTGESRPVAKYPGMSVLAGTLNNGSGPLTVRVTALATASAVANLAVLVQQAAAQKSPIESLVQVFAKWYTPLAVAVAALVALVPSLVHQESWRDWIYLALVVLVSACPCALVIGTPVATVCAIARAAASGILVKGSAHLEALAHVRTVTFDKSGTLTAGNFEVVAAHYFPEWRVATEVLSCAGALEQLSSHPIAAAVLGYAAGQGAMSLETCNTAADVVVVPGMGITGRVAGHIVALGNAALAAQEVQAALAVGGQGGDNSGGNEGDSNKRSVGWQQQQLAAAQALAEAAAAERGASACYIVVDGALAGLLLLCDSVRPNASAALAQLRASCGVRTVMLTGDGATAARAVAAQMAMDGADVHAQLLPRDKLELLQQYKARFGHIAHVGDGVNDAPALAAATVGVAMGAGGSAMAVDAADIALFDNNLLALVLALQLSRRMLWVIRWNIAFSIAVKVAVLGLAAGGRVTLWLAVLADVGSTIIVVLCSLTLLQFKRQPQSSTVPGILPHNGRGSSKSKSCCSKSSCSGAALHAHGEASTSSMPSHSGSCGGCDGHAQHKGCADAAPSAHSGNCGKQHSHAHHGCDKYGDHGATSSAHSAKCGGEHHC